VLESPDGNGNFYSQVLHQPGSRSARFSFLLPDFKPDQAGISALIEFLCFQSGEMGALNVLAEVEESHALFEILRRSGFAVYSWESIWQLPKQIQASESQSAWSEPQPQDDTFIRSLFQTLVPPLVQNAEPYTNGNTPRWIYKVNGEILAYVEIISGKSGLFLVPVIHPSVEDIESLLRDLVYFIGSNNKTIYLQVRSYQAWLSDALLNLQAQPSPRYAMMVKHLAVGQLNSVKNYQYARGDGRQAEQPTASILQQFSPNGIEPGSDLTGK
jgi:hypothetical protein